MSSSTTVKMPELLRDRDIFEDEEGRLFVTLGYIQPQDRVLAYLKYVPDLTGRWLARGTRYRRIFWGGVDSVIDGIIILPPPYIVEDSHFQTALVEPPRQVIKKYYSPEKRLAEILVFPEDELERTTKAAAETLHDELEIPIDSLGVSGSILWEGHNIAYSDINMSVYGFRHSWALRSNLEQFSDSKHQARLKTRTEWQHAIKRISMRIPALRKNDLQFLSTRRVALCIGNQCIEVKPVLLPDEAPIKYGSESYKTVSPEPIKLQMTIENDVYGIFHPALYDTSPIEFEGDAVQRIMVYDGAFGGLFRSGDLVEVSGTIQRVLRTRENSQFSQIMVGTKAGSGKEYIRLLS